jgi:hypothetical protein
MSDNGSMTITEFLEARIAEDEDGHYPYQSGDFGQFPDVRYGCVECGIMEDQSCRTQRECAAKRAIVKDCVFVSDVQDEYATGLRDDVLGHLASVYASHPDYRQEWA